MASGRKTLKQELEVLRRYQQLTPKVFGFVEEMLDSKKKSDKMWACNWLEKAYTKMIPQEISGIDGGPLEIKVINYASVGTATVPKYTTTTT
jgi:hypothetical protein